MSQQQQQEPHRTDTQEELEDRGVHTSFPYFLRADQLADGTYRYALEDEKSGRTLAEGVHADAGQALARFEESLRRTDLTADEINALRKNVHQYHDKTD